MVKKWAQVQFLVGDVKSHVPRGVAKRKKKGLLGLTKAERQEAGVCLGKEGEVGPSGWLGGENREDPHCVQPVLGSGTLSEPENLLGEPHECKPSSRTKQSPTTH